MSEQERSVTFKMIMQELVSEAAQKASAAMVKTTEDVKKAVAAANTTTTEMTKTVDEAARKFENTKVGVEKTAEAAKVRLIPAMKEVAKEAGKAATETGRIKDEAEKATKATGGLLAGSKEVGDQIQKITKVFAIAGAAVKGVEAAWRGVQLVQAIVSNDFDKQVVAANRLQSVIESLPGGGAVVGIGASINNLFTGNKDYVEDLERANKKLEAHTERMKTVGEQQKQINDAAKGYLESLNGQADSVFRTQAEINARSLVELRKQRDLIAERMAGTFSPAQRTQFLKDADQIIDHIANRQTSEMALAWTSANRELEAENLKLIGRTAEADRVTFNNSLQEKQIAAAKMGDRFAALQEKINTVLLAAFDKEANRKRQEFLTGFDADLDARALRATGDPAQGRRADTVELQFRQQRQRVELNRSMNEQGVGAADQGAMRGQLESVQRLELQHQKVTQAIDASSDAEQRFAEKIEAANALAGSGKIFDFEAQDRIKDAQARYNAEIEKTIALLKQMQAQSTDPAQQDAIQRQIDNVQTSQIKANDQVQSFAKQSASILQSSLEPAFAGIIDGTMSVKDAFKGMLKSIAKGFAELAAQLLTNLIIKKLIMAAIGGGSGGGDFSGGGSTYEGGGGDFAGGQGYAEGGLVTGGVKGVDSVNAKLMPDEYVLTPQMVPHFGLGYLEELRRRVLSGTAPVPRTTAVAAFATGGPVVGSSVGTSVSGYPILPADESTSDRLFAGGPNALISHIGRNRDAVRRVLGI
jgi:hypothetical protein